MPPFIIYGLPRSRTFWLSRLLTYGDWTCGHDEIQHARSLQDAKAWLNLPLTGTVETAGAFWWRLVQNMRPDIKTVVVRRPVAASVDSLMRTGVAFDEPRLLRAMQQLDAKLDQVERRVPGVLSIAYDDLASEEVCARIFEHCLPYKHDPAWFASMSALNLQINLGAQVRYYQAHEAQLANVARQAKQRILAAFSARPVDSASFTFQQEPFDVFFRDAKHLFAEHLVAVGEAPGAYDEKNIPLMRALYDAGALQVTTARSNGRMFGYLMAIVCPSLESESRTEALHTTFYASKDAPGLGLKLQRASIEALRARGADAVTFRAGVRGSGPKMGALYRRLGAVDDGQLFTLGLKEAV